MDRIQIRPLKTLTIKSRPLTSHALAWSCDAELAVATDDTIYIFLPEYPKVARDGEQVDQDTAIQHQFSVSLQAQGIFRPDPLVNTQLCAFEDIRLPPPDTDDDFEQQSVPGRHITGFGASLCQVIRLEWSPNGLGMNLRPVLMAMLTSGELLALGEDIDPHSTVISGLRNRNLKQWKILWGLGAGLPLPAEDHEGSYRSMDDRAKSFSWANEILPGRALLAYATDEDEIVITSVHHFVRTSSQSPEAEGEHVWQIREVARFEATGPHEDVDPMDPDYVPSGSAFSLTWSPWVSSEGSQTATISYISRNYVGFRRIIMRGQWENGDQPVIEIEESDSAGLCLYLGSDAFIKWENMVWMDGGASIARGVICTPFEVKPFQVNLSTNANLPIMDHSTSACKTTYPKKFLTNPIIDLNIHQPDSANKPDVPLYSLVRATATSTNEDWYENNATNDELHLPQWVKKIRHETTRYIPKEAAPETIQSDSDSSDSEEERDEEERAKPQIHPYRFRFWGMASSPGGGSTAVLVSKHSTQYPDRRGASKLMFEWKSPTEEKEYKTRDPLGRLTTEGQVWEWMYGGGPEVPSVMGITDVDPLLSKESSLREFLKDVKVKQICVFCDEGLTNDETEAKCSNNHSFATCTLSGLAILSPGVSHICAVCQQRCLKRSELVKLAKEHIGLEAVVPSSEDSCGGCGGKFVA